VVLIDLPDYYELHEPAAAEELLARYKEFNDPVREFWNEHKDLLVWDLLPKDFLRDLYQAWFARNNPNGKALGKNKLSQELAPLMAADGWVETANPVATTGRMDWPELLILRWSLTSWMSKTYGGKDPRQICMPDLPDRARGFIRVTAQGEVAERDEDYADATAAGPPYAVSNAVDCVRAANE